MGTATRTTDTPARTPVARRLTIARAVDQWAETTLAIEGLRGLQAEAARVILEHAEKTGKRTFKDRIAVVQSGGSTVLDQGKVIEFLIARGQVLRDFQKRTKLGWTLKLLK